MTNITSHSQMVTSLVKSGDRIKTELSSQDCALIHAVLGVSGEAGELLDSIKKHVIYRKPLDLENVIEELGDLEFYIEDLRQRLNISREHTIQANMTKLAKRYKDYQYSDSAAQQRKDKV